MSWCAAAPHAAVFAPAYTRRVFVHERGFAMRRAILFALTSSLCIAAGAQAGPAESPSGSAQPFSTAITAQGFRADDKAISSDYMDGRKPGTVGAKRATAWIVEQFKKIGLEPGNRGSWFQAVPTVSTTLQNADATRLDVNEGGGTQTFAFGTDWVANTLQAKRRSRSRTPTSCSSATASTRPSGSGTITKISTSRARPWWCWSTIPVMRPAIRSCSRARP